MKIIFFGSDDFAVVHLQALLEAGQPVVCCVTGPDKPQGRGMRIASSPVKELALGRQIPCLQPVSLKDRGTVDALRSYNADIFVVVAYGRLLTQEVLDIPKMLCMNVHGSLLPQYRGAAPINWAILNGNKETGVTIQKMALALDSGDVIAQEKMPILDDENAAQLRQRMARAGADLLVNVLGRHPGGRFPLQPQDESKVTWAPKLTKEMGKIDWNKPAEAIVNRVRGLQPWPGAYASCHGKTVKILGATACSTAPVEPGKVMEVNREGIRVACGLGSVLIQEVQPEAGKIMPAHSFAVGHQVRAGTTVH